MANRLVGVATLNTIIQVFDDFLTILNLANHKAFIGTTILITNDNVLCNVYKSTSQVTGIGCP
ncbi:hypothetical protein D3C73_999360 [compost metagenome]